MALATQALVCPHLYSPTLCSTSASTSGRSTSPSSLGSFSAAPGLLLNPQWPGRLGLGAFGRVTIAAGEGNISSGRWSGGVSAMADFQNSFTAKDLERDAAREALLLAIADAGGVDALVSGKEDKVGRITVSEKLLALERLNPTPRPTTSPLLEGLWEFKWAAARSPGVTAVRTLLKRFPATVASISSLQILIFDGTTKATANLKLLNSVENTFTLATKLTAEGPTRLKEEYVEGFLSSPNVKDGSVPSQFKGVYDQLVATIERLPSAVKEVVTNGIKVPLKGSFERQLLISYLDEEIMVTHDQNHWFRNRNQTTEIARDESGVPDVLYKISGVTPIVEPIVTVVPEYVS